MKHRKTLFSSGSSPRLLRSGLAKPNLGPEGEQDLATTTTPGYSEKETELTDRIAPAAAVLQEGIGCDRGQRMSGVAGSAAATRL